MATDETTAKVREKIAAHRYGLLGYKVISNDDKQTRRVFDIPKEEKAADLVINNRPGTCIIAEVKSWSDIAKAIEQVSNTARYVRQHYPLIEPKIIVSHTILSEDRHFLGGHYYASRVWTGTYQLVDGRGNVVCIEGGEVVMVVSMP